MFEIGIEETRRLVAGVVEEFGFRMGFIGVGVGVGVRTGAGAGAVRVVVVSGCCGGAAGAGGFRGRGLRGGGLAVGVCRWL